MRKNVALIICLCVIGSINAVLALPEPNAAETTPDTDLSPQLTKVARHIPQLEQSLTDHAQIGDPSLYLHDLLETTTAPIGTEVYRSKNPLLGFVHAKNTLTSTPLLTALATIPENDRQEPGAEQALQELYVKVLSNYIIAHASGEQAEKNEALSALDVLYNHPTYATLLRPGLMYLGIEVMAFLQNRNSAQNQLRPLIQKASAKLLRPLRTQEVPEKLIPFKEISTLLRTIEDFVLQTISSRKRATTRTLRKNIVIALGLIAAGVLVAKRGTIKRLLSTLITGAKDTRMIWRHANPERLEPQDLSLVAQRGLSEQYALSLIDRVRPSARQGRIHAANAHIQELDPEQRITREIATAIAQHKRIITDSLSKIQELTLAIAQRIGSDETATAAVREALREQLSQAEIEKSNQTNRQQELAEEIRLLLGDDSPALQMLTNKAEELSRCWSAQQVCQNNIARLSIERDRLNAHLDFLGRIELERAAATNNDLPTLHAAYLQAESRALREPTTQRKKQARDAFTAFSDAKAKMYVAGDRIAAQHIVWQDTLKAISTAPLTTLPGTLKPLPEIAEEREAHARRERYEETKQWRHDIVKKVKKAAESMPATAPTEETFLREKRNTAAAKQIQAELAAACRNQASGAGAVYRLFQTYTQEVDRFKAIATLADRYHQVFGDAPDISSARERLENKKNAYIAAADQLSSAHEAAAQQLVELHANTKFTQLKNTLSLANWREKRRARALAKTAADAADKEAQAITRDAETIATDLTRLTTERESRARERRNPTFASVAAEEYAHLDRLANVLLEAETALRNREQEKTVRAFAELANTQKEIARLTALPEQNAGTVEALAAARTRLAEQTLAVDRIKQGLREAQDAVNAHRTAYESAKRRDSLTFGPVRRALGTSWRGLRQAATNLTGW